MTPSPSSLSRRVSAPCVSCPSLLVRRLGRGLGRPSRLSGRFGPVGHPSGSVVYHRQGPASCSAGAFPVPVTSPRSHSGCLLRWLHCCAFPSQGGWPLVSYPQLLGSGDLALDGVHLHPPASPVPSGLRHRPPRLPVSPSPAHTSRVVFTHDRLSVFEKTVAGSIVFFATSATHRGSIYFSPFRDPWSAGTDAFLQFWDSLRAYAFPPVAVIRVLSRGSGHPRGRDSLLWLSTGLSALSFRTWSSSRWLLQWSYRPVYTSCSWLGLVLSTRISVGSGFMPDASPALSKSSWLLLRCGGAVCTGAPSVLARSVSGTMVRFLMGTVTPMAIPFLILPWLW